MKILFTGTRHDEEEEIEVQLEYEGDDNWTLITDKEEFTITNLQPAIKFLLEDWERK